jgi:tetratricopeptide (TPR) repeat protein
MRIWKKIVVILGIISLISLVFAPATAYIPEAVTSYNTAIDLNEKYRYERALVYLDEAIRIDPDFFEAWYSRGYSLAMLNDYEEALKSYDKAVEIKANDTDAWFSRGYVLNKIGRYDEAITSYDMALEIKPNNYKAWNSRGIAFYNLGLYNESIASYEKAIDINFDSMVFQNLQLAQEAAKSANTIKNISNQSHPTDQQVLTTPLSTTEPTSTKNAAVPLNASITKTPFPGTLTMICALISAVIFSTLRRSRRE